ncbi:E3 ubiquitin-protein ligase complex slx8-rfp subunit slx8-like, partial [Pipra filicauda]|uniref:E3 ubiquitin-protein ligase complex slx8-rfp subunit slx8-like n=1 Tax=Pipra filicauda TaxID=649802 RepID=A0A7R5K6I1_9PASS
VQLTAEFFSCSLHSTTRPSATLTNVLYQDCFLGQWEQNQQHPAGNPVVSSAADNSVVLLTSDDEEEPRDNDGTRPAAPVTSPTWIDDYSELLEGYEQQRRNLTPRSQQLLDSPVLRSYDEYETADDVTDVESEVTDVESEVTDVESEVTDVESEVTDVESEVTDVESEVTDVESEVTDVESEVTDVESEVTDVESEVTDVESEVIDIEYGAADMEYGAADIQYEAAYVEPEVRRSLDEELAISEEWQRAVRCPICMDFFSQIIRSVRQVVSTQCGHLFCSRCIAVALENSRACPTCRTELPPRDYHPVYF